MAQQIDIQVRLKDLITGPLGNVRKAIQGIASTAASVLKITAVAVAGVGVAAGGAIAALVREGSALEDLRLQLRGVSKDWEEASARLQVARDLNDLIPTIDDAEFVQGMVRLEAVGVQHVRAVLAELASLSTIFKTDLPAAVNAFVRPTSRSLLQFGIEMKTVKGNVVLATKGFDPVTVKNSLADIREAVLDLFQRKFPNAVELAVNQFKVKWAGLKDEIGDIMAEVGETLLPAAKSAVDAITTIFKEHHDQIVAFFSVLPQTVQTVVDFIRSKFADAGLFAGMANIFSNTLKFLVGESGQFLALVAQAVAVAAPIIWAPLRVAFSALLVDMGKQLNEWWSGIGDRLANFGGGMGFTSWIAAPLKLLGAELRKLADDNVAILEAEGAGIVQQSAEKAAESMRAALAGIGPLIAEFGDRWKQFKAGLAESVSGDVRATGFDEVLRQIREGIQQAEGEIVRNREHLRAVGDTLDGVKGSAAGAAEGIADVGKAMKAVKDALEQSKPQLEADERLVELKKLQLELIIKAAAASGTLATDARAAVDSALSATNELLAAQRKQLEDTLAGVTAVRDRFRGTVPDSIIADLTAQMDVLKLKLKDLGDPGDEIAESLKPLFDEIAAQQNQLVDASTRRIQLLREEMDVLRDIGGSYAQRLQVARDWATANQRSVDENLRLKQFAFDLVPPLMRASKEGQALADQLALARFHAAETAVDIRRVMDEIEPSANWAADFAKGFENAREALRVTRADVKRFGEDLAQAMSAQSAARGLSQAFTDVLFQVRSLRDGIREWAVSTLQAIARIITEMLILKAISASMSLLFGGASTPTSSAGTAAAAPTSTPAGSGPMYVAGGLQARIVMPYLPPQLRGPQPFESPAARYGAPAAAVAASSAEPVKVELHFHSADARGARELLMRERDTVAEIVADAVERKSVTRRRIRGG